MRTILSREFIFRQEILPIVSISILLNIIPHYLIDQDPALRSFLFLDMAGTMLAAVMLGPWYGASAGVLSSTINGLYFTSYFPFGIVSIVTALAWGYFARATVVGRSTERWWPIGAWKYICGVIAYALVGSLVAGIVSSGIKLILYPSMGLPLTLNKPFYIDIAHWVHGLSLFSSTDAVALIIGDWLRELADKLVVAALGLLFIRLLHSSMSPALRSPERSAWRRVVTDEMSVVTFGVAYSVYLLLGRIYRPTLDFAQAPHPVTWLAMTDIVMLLYLPIVLALAAYLAATFEGSSTVGREYEALRRQRAQLYMKLWPRWTFRRGDMEKSEAFAMMRFDGVYGMIATIFLWPAKSGGLNGSAGPVLSIIGYVGATVLFGALFIAQRNDWWGNVVRVHRQLDVLRRWFVMPQPEADSREVLFKIVESLHGTVIPARDILRITDRSTYTTATIVPGTRVASMLAHAKGSALLIILLRNPRSLGEESGAHILSIMEQTGVGAAIVVASGVDVDNPAGSQWLADARMRGHVIAPLFWFDVESAIFAIGRDAALSTVIGEGLARYAGWSKVAGDDGADEPPTTVETLARRALPGVKYLIDSLPRESQVVDLGCGRGRHSVAAVLAGHSVIAIDRDVESIARLNKLASDLGVGRRLVVRHESYVETSNDIVKPADLVISTGVLQHTKGTADLERHFEQIRRWLVQPGCKLYIEMLFGMKFDGVPPTDGRAVWERKMFEETLSNAFAAPVWSIHVLQEPMRRDQTFHKGARSFTIGACRVECVSIEYLVERLQ